MHEKQASLFAAFFLLLWKVASVLVNHLHARDIKDPDRHTAVTKACDCITCSLTAQRYIKIGYVFVAVNGGFEELYLIELIALSLKLSFKYLFLDKPLEFPLEILRLDRTYVCSNVYSFLLYSVFYNLASSVRAKQTNKQTNK